jgi:splicing factor U2AF subunit
VKHVSDADFYVNLCFCFEVLINECMSLLSQYGEIEEMNVCDNLDHLVGNVYIKISLYFWAFHNVVKFVNGVTHFYFPQFQREEDSEKAVSNLNSHWFGERPVFAEFIPVTDFREACCHQYEMGLVACLKDS